MARQKTHRPPFRSNALLCVLPALAALMSLPMTSAQASELRSRFGFCAPPFAPPCAGKTAMSPKEIKACETETERYVASVFAYRGCLAAETERAVREANATIQKMRCAKDASLCAAREAAPDPVAPGKPKPARKRAKPQADR